MNIMLKQGDNLHRENPTDSGADLKAKGYQRVINDKLDKNIVWLEDGDDFFIAPNETILIKTGVHIELPDPEIVTKWGEEWLSVCEFNVRPRSGLSLKENVGAVFGTGDNCYRGDSGIIFKNDRDCNYRVVKDDRVGQLVLTEAVIPMKINVVDKINEGSRGENGFGSSGKN